MLALGAEAFTDLLSAAATLLGQPAVASAAGTDADLWVVAGSGDLALAVWTVTGTGAATLHAGLRWQPVVSQAGGPQGRRRRSGWWPTRWP